jgi:hypothetical protein
MDPLEYRRLWILSVTRIRYKNYFITQINVLILYIHI